MWEHYHHRVCLSRCSQQTYLKDIFPVYFLRDGDDDNNALTLAQKSGHIGGLMNRRDCGLDLLAGILNGQKASDEQQHPFALLSLVNPAHTAHITPNYKVTLAEVFTNFARTMIENRGRISFSTTPFVVITLELDPMIPK